MTCHSCRIDTVKAGKQKDGSQRYKCQQCGKRYTEQKARIFGDDSRLPEEKSLMILRCLLEGNSVRSTARLCDVEPKTVLHILVLASERAERLLGDKLRNVPVRDVQADEIWSFVGCKEKIRAARGYDESLGDAYTFVAIERTSKLIVAWHLGKRTPEDTLVFAHKLDRATAGSYQLTTDGYGPYRTAIPQTLGSRVDFAQLIKEYGSEGVTEQRRYSPPTVIGIDYQEISGAPMFAKACTSHIERSNLSLRMAARRFTRLTNGFSKKWENHEAALALWFAYYNFARRHMTLKETPAMASGLENHQWTIRELIEESAKF